jgi:hypothetical protein
MAGASRALVGCAIALALAAVVVVVIVGGDERSARSPAAAARAGSHAHFVSLASKSSNYCGLQAAGITRFGDEHRLQGSCCSAMDEHAYREQVEQLRAYRGIRQIPRDPYDISASLVKRLLEYDRRMSLTGGQHRTYARSMAMSEQKGPCCCPCWRWTAFRGLAKFLISDRHWRSRRVATVIDLLEGCGGPNHHHGGARA